MSKICNLSEIKVQQHSRELELLNEKLPALETRIKECEDNTQKHVISSDSLYENQVIFMKKFNEIKEFTSSSIETMKRISNSVEKRIEQLESQMASVMAILHDLNDKINTIAESQEARFSEANNSLGQTVKSLQNQINGRCDEITETLYVPPNQIMKDNEEIKTKLDNALISAENSMMKCNVHGMNIKLLEKRVENLSLQIKEFELNKKLEVR